MIIIFCGVDRMEHTAENGGQNLITINLANAILRQQIHS